MCCLLWLKEGFHARQELCRQGAKCSSLPCCHVLGVSSEARGQYCSVLSIEPGCDIQLHLNVELESMALALMRTLVISSDQDLSVPLRCGARFLQDTC